MLSAVKRAVPGEIKASTFPEAIASIPSNGSETVSGLITGTITGDLVDHTATSVRGHCFAFCNLTSVKLPNAYSVGTEAFIYCTSLTKVDFPAVTIGSQAFVGCSALTALILRYTQKVCKLQSPDVFYGSSGIILGTGYIYVPAALVNSYKADADWSPYASQIRAIEDYPDICG